MHQRCSRFSNLKFKFSIGILKICTTIEWVILDLLSQILPKKETLTYRQNWPYDTENDLLLPVDTENSEIC